MAVILVDSLNRNAITCRSDLRKRMMWRVEVLGWGSPLHHEYATAGAEFQHAFLQVIRFHHPTAPADELERRARELLQHL